MPHLADFLLRGNYETTSGYPWQSQISFVNNPNLHLMPENLIQNILDKHDPYLIQLLKRNKNIHLMPESIKQSMYEKGYFNQTLN